MTVLYVVLAAIVGALAGTWHEYYTGRFDHFMRRMAKRNKPAAPPFSHEAFLDGCEYFNRRMLETPIDQRVFEDVETVQ